MKAGAVKNLNFHRMTSVTLLRIAKKKKSYLTRLHQSSHLLTIILIYISSFHTFTHVSSVHASFSIKYFVVMSRIFHETRDRNVTGISDRMLSEGHKTRKTNCNFRFEFTILYETFVGKMFLTNQSYYIIILWVYLWI